MAAAAAATDEAAESKSEFVDHGEVEIHPRVLWHDFDNARVKGFYRSLVNNPIHVKEMSEERYIEEKVCFPRYLSVNDAIQLPSLPGGQFIGRAELREAYSQFRMRFSFRVKVTLTTAADVIKMSYTRIDREYQKKSQPSEFVLKVIGEDSFVYGKQPRLVNFEPVAVDVIDETRNRLDLVHLPEQQRMIEECGIAEKTHRAGAKRHLRCEVGETDTMTDEQPKPSNESRDQLRLVVPSIDIGRAVKKAAAEYTSSVRWNKSKGRWFWSINVICNGEQIMFGFDSKEIPIEGTGVSEGWLCDPQREGLNVGQDWSVSRLTFDCTLCVLLVSESKSILKLHGWLKIPLFEDDGHGNAVLIQGTHQFKLWESNTHSRKHFSGIEEIITELSLRTNIPINLSAGMTGDSITITFAELDCPVCFAVERDEADTDELWEWLRKERTPDLSSKANMRLLDELVFKAKSEGVRNLSSADRKRLFLFRFDLTHDWHNLPLLCEAINWSDPIQRGAVFRLLRHWASPMIPYHCLSVLRFRDDRLRDHALNFIDNFDTNQWVLSMPLMIRLLNNEHCHDSKLFRLIIESVLRDDPYPRAFSLFWSLHCALLAGHIQSHVTVERLTLMLDELLLMCPKKCSDDFTRSWQVCEKLSSLVSDINNRRYREYRSTPEMMMQKGLDLINKAMKLSEKSWLNPMNPRMRLGQISCSDSGSWNRVNIHNTDERAPELTVELECVTDFHDQSVSDLFGIFADHWNREGLGSLLRWNKCVVIGGQPTTKDDGRSGFIQMREAWEDITLRDIKESSEDSIRKFLARTNRSEMQFRSAKVRFSCSLAMWSVIILTFGGHQTHSSEIRLCNDGTMFVNCLSSISCEKKIWGVRRESIGMIATDMLPFLKSKEDKEHFERKLGGAATAIRHRCEGLASMVQLMGLAGLLNVQDPSSIGHSVVHSMELTLSDEEFERKIKSEMQRAMKPSRFDDHVLRHF